MNFFKDVRNSQIVVLLTLYVFSLFLSQTILSPVYALSVSVSAIVFQYAFEKYNFQTPRRAWWKSALISSFSLVLLLRLGSYPLYFLASFITIASKFLLRDFTGKHVFNPTNFTLAVFLIFLPSYSWIEYGHWGRESFMVILTILIAPMVLKDLRVFKVAFMFLAFYILLFGGRHFWLGDPWSVFFHQISNVSLLVFAFFMISDPRTAPNSLKGQLLFTFAIVAATLYWEGFLYKRNGLIIMLALFCSLTPILNKYLPGEIYQWKKSYV